MNKYYGQFDPPVDSIIFERYFPDLAIKGIFVECGAAGGLIESSCKFFEESMGWDGYNLEPAPPNFETLKNNRPNSNNIPIGLSNFDGKTEFLHAVSPIWGQDFGNGSIEHTAEHLRSLEETGCSFVKYEITVKTWKSFIAEQGISRVDLFVLDVEGHELSVLEGMKGCSVLPDVICIEVGHLPFEMIRNTLSDLGYVYDISSHVNAFFVREKVLALFELRQVSTLPSKLCGIFNANLAQIQSTLKMHDELLLKIDSFIREEQTASNVKINELQNKLEQIYSSKSWRFATKLSRVKRLFYRSFT